MGRLDGKVAIVTGAGQGVGLGIAQTFAAEGASLLLTGRHEDKLRAAVETFGDHAERVAICAGDARSRADAERAVATAVERFARLDVLVNNAQSSAPGTSIEETDDETLRLTIESGFYGTFFHMQAALPHLKERGGSIINLGSREGIMGGVGFGAYAATKEAIRAISRVAAREWGQHKIRVNVICPAALSPIAVQYLADHPDKAEMYRKEVALGYFGDPRDEIGPAALFLASDDSHYVTGQTINVDGGQTML